VANKSNARMGRPPGSKNKQTVGMLLAQRKGISPLEFLLSVMDDKELAALINGEQEDQVH
jgi:hypothetical protein